MGDGDSHHYCRLPVQFGRDAFDLYASRSGGSVYAGVLSSVEIDITYGGVQCCADMYCVTVSVDALSYGEFLGARETEEEGNGQCASDIQKLHGDRIGYDSFFAGAGISLPF